jgi:2-polyprenyl-6-methoxyphenol hydroxylase-like FAD-dependent oxidoreductase
MAGRVVIVGAGPAGACLALQLSRAGVATTLVEASRRFARSFRGEALMPSGLEALAAMNLQPLLQNVPQRSLLGWRVVVNGREVFSVPEPPAGEAGPGCTLVSQPALLEALVKACRSQPGFRWLPGRQATDLLEERDRIQGVRLGDGETLRADLVVACDGRNSLLRNRAGLVLEERPQAIDLLWMHLRGGDAPPLGGHFLTVLGDQGLFSAFESVSGGLQLGWVIGAQERTATRNAKAWIEGLASQSPAPLAAWLRRWGDALEEPGRLHVRSGLASSWWRPGLLLLGDAAHPMSPVRAQGINMALRDAWVAAGLLTAPLLAGAAPHRLDTLLPLLAERRRTEVAALQRLQELETARGNALRCQPWLRSLVAAAAPWIGPSVGHHWQLRQQPLRLGLTPAAAMMAP